MNCEKYSDFCVEIDGDCKPSFIFIWILIQLSSFIIRVKMD